MSRIYILGSVCSGKTTLARRLSIEMNISHYELDTVVWKSNANGDIKRSDDEILEIFQNIISQENWIIEDVGRKKFKAGLEQADKIIYLNISRQCLKRRILIRWIKQNLKIEKAAYKSDFKMLKQMYIWMNDELTRDRLHELEKYKYKLIILNEKNINNYRGD